MTAELNIWTGIMCSPLSSNRPRRSVQVVNPLLFVILLFVGVSAGCDSSETEVNHAMEYVNNTIRVIIEHPSGFNISIADNITNLKCTWGTSSCYIQCEVLNISSNISDLIEESISILKNETQQLNFMLNQSQTKCNVTVCDKNVIQPLMNDANNTNCTADDLKRLLNMKNMCEVLFNDKFLLQYNSLENKCIHDIIRIPFEGKRKDYDLEDLALSVINTEMYSLTGDFLNITAPQVLGLSQPVDIMIPKEPFQNVTGVQRNVAVVTYSPSQQFLTGKPTPRIVSVVIRLEVVEREIKNLRKPLCITFPVNTQTDASSNQTLSCQYYDDTDPLWKSQGCSLSKQENNNVQCTCDHMTPFAVLLIDVQIDQKQWEILSYISYVGCCISAVFSAASVIFFMVKKPPNMDSSISIHVSLGATLFLLNTSFLFSEWAATWTKNACVFVAVTMQYSLLCSFSWMSIEALHLYLLLVKVFNTYIRHYMVKLSLLGWGVPAVFVAASLTGPFYGTKRVELTDNKTSEICWITDVKFLYGMNITFFSVTFLVNTAILTIVTCQITKIRRLGVKHSKQPTWKDACTVLGLSCLLGMTWGLAFFSSGYTNYPILYLFCICNTLQGFFIFLWVYGTMQKNRRLETETLPPSETSSSTHKLKKYSFSKNS